MVKRIERCAATDVDPDTGIRDLTIPRTLMDSFDHTDCGIYAEVWPPATSPSAMPLVTEFCKKTPRSLERGAIALVA